MERIIDIDLSAPLMEFKRKILLKKAFKRNSLLLNERRTIIHPFEILERNTYWNSLTFYSK